MYNQTYKVFFHNWPASMQDYQTVRTIEGFYTGLLWDNNVTVVIVLGLGRHSQPRHIKSSSTTYKKWRLTRKVIEAYVLFSFRSEKPDVPQFRSVHEWLKFINMEKYSEVFKAANIKSLQKVIRLDDTKLKGMGITLIGHRNKMLKSIRSMKSQFVNRALDDDEAAIQWCLLFVGFKGAMSCGYCCFRSIPY